MRKLLFGKSAWLPTLCISGALALFSCTDSNNKPQTAETSAPVKGDWIITHDLSDPEGLNPFTTSDASSSKIGKLIFEAMLELDYKTAELYPVIAESRPEISEDHLTYTFKLRNNVKFSDGKPLTSKDVIFSFKAIKNPLIISAASLRNYFLDVKNVEALDDYTVKITMSKPYFLAEHFLGGLQILPKHILDPQGLTDQYTFEETNDPAKATANKAMNSFSAWFSAPERNRNKEFLVGTGPYTFEEWRTNEDIKLKRFDGYWNAGKDEYKTSYPNFIVFRTITDRTTAVNSLKNQELDFMEYVPPAMADDIDTAVTTHLRKQFYAVPTYMYIGWNQRRPVFSDKKTRQALSYLVDKDMLIKTVMRGAATPTESPVYSGRPEYDSTLNKYAYNPAKAKQLLTEAGWADSNGDGILDRMINGKRTDLAFTFLLNAGNEMRENIALLLANEFKKIGIKAELQKIEWSVFLENLKSGKFDAMIGAWVNDPTPSDLFQIWHSSQIQNKGSNYAAFNVPRADQLIESIRTEFDDAKRMEYYREFQRIVSDEQPYTFLWLMKNPAVYHSRIQNVSFYNVRPGYVPNNWWVPQASQRYRDAQ